MSELKVGALALLAIFSLGYLSYRVTQNQSGFGEYVAYKTILEDASGILERSPIKVAGIVKGRIKSLQLSGTKAVIQFEVLEDVKVTENSKLKIKSVGLLGDKYLDIDMGAPAEERLPPGSFVPSEMSGGFDQVTNDAGVILADVKVVVSKIKDAITDAEEENRVKKILANVDDITTTLKRLAKGNEESVNRIISDFEQISSQLAYETDRSQQQSVMGALKELNPVMAKVKSAVDDLQIIIADVKAGKGTVGKLLRDEEVVDQVSETLTSVNRLVNRIVNIEAEVGLFTGINTDHGNHTQFDLDIFPAPERFFRIGLVTNDFGPVVDEETETTTTINDGATSVETRREIRKDAFKFNLQIGRKIQRFAIRAGLIESTGGVGLDYHLLDYGLRLGLEAFDYQEEAGLNLRFLTEFRIWNVFYSRFHAEDLVSKTDNRSFTFTVGLRFTDQDLASLVGLLAR